VTTSTTASPATGGPAAARRRRPRPSLDRITFMAAFLGLPLVIFVLFVVWPVLQALYYSMTDWSGFSASMNFTGLDNYRKLAQDDIFLHAVRNNIELAIVVPLLTIAAALAIAIVVTVGGPSRRSRASRRRSTSRHASTGRDASGPAGRSRSR